MAPLVDLLSSVLEPSSEGQFLARFSTLFLVASLLLFFTLVCIAWVRSGKLGAGHQGGPSASAVRGLSTPFWWLGLSLALASVAGLNLVVDPYGMYGSGILAPVSMQMRRLKAEAYAALPEAPQVVVLGSSVAHSISPWTFRERLGFSAFNAAVGTGRINDFLIQAKFMRSAQEGRLPRVFFVQLAPGLPYGGGRTADLTPPSQLPFMRPTTALLAVAQRASRSIGRKQTGDSLYVLLTHPYRPQTAAREIDRHGERRTMIDARQRSAPRSERRFELRLSRFIRRAQASRGRGECRQLDPRAVRDLDEFLRLTAGRGSAVVFYLSPIHPRFRREVQSQTRHIPNCRSLLKTRLHAMAAADESVDFLDFSLLESIDGDPSSAGYTDPFHLTFANGDRIIAAAATTLRTAVARASVNEQSDDTE